MYCLQFKILFCINCFLSFVFVQTIYITPSFHRVNNFFAYFTLFLFDLVYYFNTRSINLGDTNTSNQIPTLFFWCNDTNTLRFYWFLILKNISFFLNTNSGFKTRMVLAFSYTLYGEGVFYYLSKLL